MYFNFDGISVTFRSWKDLFYPKPVSPKTSKTWYYRKFGVSGYYNKRAEKINDKKKRS